ncbi:hypothetical protein [Robbsia andropogonis]|uniref:hypothetical protein n=1 Tax=Robbsia andropogonis TaxID=28092 RepID=UPI0012FC9609|nr:hypothetical protein [Robbsia andropogonis]
MPLHLFRSVCGDRLNQLALNKIGYHEVRKLSANPLPTHACMNKKGFAWKEVAVKKCKPWLNIMQ